jgi:23S rRNA pseudouridine2605 synthase
MARITSRTSSGGSAPKGRRGRGDNKPKFSSDKPEKDFVKKDNRKSADGPRERKRPAGERPIKGGGFKKTAATGRPPRDGEAPRRKPDGERTSTDRPKRGGAAFTPRGERSGSDRPFKKFESNGPTRRKRFDKQEEVEQKPRFRKSSKDLDTDFTPKKAFISRAERDGQIRLNKYLSMAGIASRRDADELIGLGLITVNGKVVTELGLKIDPQKDVVKYDDRVIRAEQYRYVLLNKPKGFICTMDDPKGRETVMNLVNSACAERIYPVGRLDKETSGLLLFTNDGDLAKKLTHPRHKASKIYHVELNRPVSSEDLMKLMKGIDLEDGRTVFDLAEYVKDGSNREVGVELHSGKNRIVRRMFEAMGYDVVKLDRVQFSGLTKKDLPRGMFRHLTDKEVAFLKMS